MQNRVAYSIEAGEDNLASEYVGGEMECGAERREADRNADEREELGRLLGSLD